MESTKRRVLVLVDWFEPGYKAGGPIRSVVNFIHHLKDELDIYVLTTDRDLNEKVPYKGIETDKWIEYKPGVYVFYCSPRLLSFSAVIKIINWVNADFIYLNSMFSKFFTIYPLLAKRLGKIRSEIVLAPRGMLKETALQFKNRKKKLFLKIFKSLGLNRNVRFHATDTNEFNDILRTFGRSDMYLVVDNLPGIHKPFVPLADKLRGNVKLLFVGRFHPIKNPDYLLSVLKETKSNVELTIIATIEDEDYWHKCQVMIAHLPSNVKVIINGEMPHAEIEHHLLETHLFVLPTRGENFGHAIFEALMAGRPVLISDQTPWKDLAAKKAGWELPLADKEQFLKAIEKVAAMDHDELNEWSKGAWNYSNDQLDLYDVRSQYLKLFS
ncbi:MAG TPA: glycosyltransferase family 4 protein [Chitinophagaceae bacterium]